MTAFSKAVEHIPMSAWRSYLRCVVIYTWAPYLSNGFVKTQFSLVGDITGASQIAPRWKRAIHAIESLLGDALGKLFVAKAFSPDAKSGAANIVRNIRAALRARIAYVDWLSPETQTRAVKKLDQMTVKIGYPDRWQDYSALRFTKTSYLANVLAAEAFNWQHELSKLTKRVDRSEWGLSACDTAAIYNPVENELVLPAGILQPGFFDLKADDASNYGGIGSIIGHEMTHGFDNQGSLVDGQGNFRSWWTQQDRESFQDAASHILGQYNAYRSPEDLPVNGSLTLDENIADIGGLRLAYQAYHNNLGSAHPPLRDGLTGDQRFFIAFAQNFRAHYRPDVAEISILTDIHAPDSVRVLGALTDEEEFYRAFGLTVPRALPHVW